MCVCVHAAQGLQVYVFTGERENVCGVCVFQVSVFTEEGVCVCSLQGLQLYMFTEERARARVCVCVCVCVCARARARACWEALGMGPGCLLGGCAACILAQ